MRLSEAIRLGSGLVEQCRSSLFRFSRDGKVDGGCALGTALISLQGDRILGQVHDFISQENLNDAGVMVGYLKEQFPILNMPVQHPEMQLTAQGKMFLGSIIPSLNDSYEWTLDQIVDFVEKCENLYYTQTKEKDLHLEKAVVYYD